MIIRYNENRYDLSKKNMEEEDYKGLWGFLKLARRLKSILKR